MKKTTQLTLAALTVLSLGAISASAASFDCRKASNGIEKPSVMILNSTDLMQRWVDSTIKQKIFLA